MPAPPHRWPRSRCPTSTSDSTTSTPTASCATSTFPQPRDIWRSRCSPAASSPSPAALSAAELATMFHIYFLGSSEGLVFDVANAELRCRAVEPVAPSIWSRSARASTPAYPSTAVRRPNRDFACAPIPAPTFDCDGVVLATDVAGLQHIVDGSPGLGDDDWRARVDTMGTAPPFVVQRLWLDRPVRADRARVPRHGRASAAGQCQRARTLRTGSRRRGPTAPVARSSSCTPTR